MRNQLKALGLLLVLSASAQAQVTMGYEVHPRRTQLGMQDKTRPVHSYSVGYNFNTHFGAHAAYSYAPKLSTNYFNQGINTTEYAESKYSDGRVMATASHKLSRHFGAQLGAGLGYSDSVNKFQSGGQDQIVNSERQFFPTVSTGIHMMPTKLVKVHALYHYDAKSEASFKEKGYFALGFTYELNSKTI